MHFQQRLSTQVFIAAVNTNCSLPRFAQCIHLEVPALPGCTLNTPEAGLPRGSVLSRRQLSALPFHEAGCPPTMTTFCSPRPPSAHRDHLPNPPTCPPGALCCTELAVLFPPFHTLRHLNQLLKQATEQSTHKVDFYCAFCPKIGLTVYEEH